MFDFLKAIKCKDEAPEKKENSMRIALSALLLEVAQSDDEFSEEERALVVNIVKEKFGLDKKETDDLLEAAEEERKQSIDMWHFANIINDNYSKEEKIDLIEMLWDVVYADKVLDKHEDYLMHILYKLLKLDHNELIAAKLQAKSKIDAT